MRMIFLTSNTWFSVFPNHTPPFSLKSTPYRISRERWRAPTSKLRNFFSLFLGSRSCLRDFCIWSGFTRITGHRDGTRPHSAAFVIVSRVTSRISEGWWLETSLQIVWPCNYDGNSNKKLPGWQTSVTTQVIMWNEGRGSCFFLMSEDYWEIAQIEWEVGYIQKIFNIS